jgi:hypothetical protein
MGKGALSMRSLGTKMSRYSETSKMQIARTLCLFAICLALAASSSLAQENKPNEESGFRVPTFQLTGKLAKIFSIQKCEYISGLTCRIRYNGAAPLPSEVYFTEFDQQGRKVGPRVRLIYPKLKPKETGVATFRIRMAEPTKIVLQGEWNGPWRDPY